MTEVIRWICQVLGSAKFQIIGYQKYLRNVSIGLVQLLSEFTEVARPRPLLVWAD